MKKIIALLFIVVCILSFLIVRNIENSYETIEFLFDTNENYIGFINAPIKYTVEDAEKDGCFVKQGIEIIANNDVWDNFIETTSQGKNIGIRIVGFYEDDSNSPYFTDLFFNDGYYYLFDSSSENQEKQPFLYLLILGGKFGIPLKDHGVVVLTNDNTLTFDIIMKSMLSSSLDFIQSISPYKLIMFQ